MQIFF